MSKKLSIDLSKGPAAARYFSQAYDAEESNAADKEEIKETAKSTKAVSNSKELASTPVRNSKEDDDTNVRPRRKTIGRPKLSAADRSKKEPHTIYLSPETAFSMERHMSEFMIKKSDLVEAALIEYLKKYQN